MCGRYVISAILDQMGALFETGDRPGPAPGRDAARLRDLPVAPRGADAGESR